ncbi:MAG: rod shape-determining protein MreD [Acidimicrobiales bacterium]|nr:rod shape-determining protein MreD [Acidimicrobiales bacterium]
MTGRFRVLALLLSAAIFQATVFDELRLNGVSVEYLLLVSLLAGFHGGPDRGAWVAFLAGLLHDSVCSIPLGVHALVFAPVAATAGHLSVRLADGARALAVAGLAGMVMVGVIGASCVGALFGLHANTGVDLVLTAGISALMTLVVFAPTNRIVRWAVTGGLPVDISLDQGPRSEGPRKRLIASERSSLR